MPGEIVTLQLGNYANYVGAHYWNLQDECQGYGGKESWDEYAATVDHDVLYMSQEDRNGGLSYRPRLLALDLSGSLGGVSFGRDAFSEASASMVVTTWSGGCEVHRAPAVPKSAFVEHLDEAEHNGPPADEQDEERQQAALEAAARQLDGSGTVKYWTDYCKALMHPRSVYTLPGIWAGCNEFGGFGDAADVLHNAEALEEMADRVRFFGEACDSLQGFQVLADDLTGFGGLAEALLTDVAQEYRGRPVVLFSLRPALPGAEPRMGTALARQQLSEGMAVARASELAALYVPVAAPHDVSALPYLRYSPTTAFQASAIVASAIDTALLPPRLTGQGTPLGPAQGAVNLHSLVQLLLGRGGAGMAALRLGLPAASLPADLQQLELQLQSSLQPPHCMAAASGAAADARASAAPAAGPSGRPAAPSAESLRGSTVGLALQHLAYLTPGVADEADDCLAESITLRGGRTAAGPASVAAVQSMLDALLMRDPRRCVRHRCIAPMPMPVPLPFPSLFRHSVSPHGDVVASRQPARTPSESVATVPVLTKLVATRAFEGALGGLRTRWAQAAGTASGRAVLDAWGISGAEADEVSEHLTGMAGRYADGEEEG